MANFAQIEGDQIHFYNRELVDTKSLSDFLEQLHPNTGWVSPRLPEGTVFTSSHNDYTIYIVEQKPRIVSLFVGYGLEEFLPQYVDPQSTADGHFYYRVPVPWEYYVMSIADKSVSTGFGQQIYQTSGLSLWWSRTQVKDLDQRSLVPAALPNVGQGGGVCMGDNSSEYQIPHEKMADTVYNFYESDFNYDLGMSSGMCAELYQWLRYADDHNTVDLDDNIFILPTDGTSILDIVKGQGFTKLEEPNQNFTTGNKGFLQRLMMTLPEQDGLRLMDLLRSRIPEATEE